MSILFHDTTLSFAIIIHYLLAICSDYFWLLFLVAVEVSAGPHLFFWTCSTDQGHFSGKVALNLGGARLGHEWVKSIDPQKGRWFNSFKY